MLRKRVHAITEFNDISFLLPATKVLAVEFWEYHCNLMMAEEDMFKKSIFEIEKHFFF
jgi:hypothetical protein